MEYVGWVEVAIGDILAVLFVCRELVVLVPDICGAKWDCSLCLKFLPTLGLLG